MDNPYIPRVVRILRIQKETPDIKTFSLECPMDFSCGQFLEVSSFGTGEAPISISSSPGEKFLQISFKRVGCVTEGLFNLKKNDYLGIRGPFGNGFPIEQLESKDIIFIAGGVGLAPLKSLLKFIICAKRIKTGNITLLYGARTAQDMLYKKELEVWAKQIKVLLTVDTPSCGWKGRVGVVTLLLDEIKINSLKTKAILCGPEIMMRFVSAKLIELGVNTADIVLSLERQMKCGMGKCGHCYIADKFTCVDGPVFTRAELDGLVPTEII